MKKVPHMLFMLVLLPCVLSACSPKDVANNKKETDKIVVDGMPENGVVFVGSKEQVEGAKKDMKELIDPAYDHAVLARRYYENKEYDKAEQKCLKALELGKQGVVKTSAHRTLSYVYEATKKYDLAIKEINWLLDHVNEHAKPDLLKKKADLEKLLK